MQLDYILRGRAALLRDHDHPKTCNQAARLVRARVHRSIRSSVEAQTRLAGPYLVDRVIVVHDRARPTTDLDRADGRRDQALAASPRISLAHYCQWRRCFARHAEPMAGGQSPSTRRRLSLEPQTRSNALARASARCKLYTGSLDEVIPDRRASHSPQPSRSWDLSLGTFRIGAAHLLQSRTRRGDRLVGKSARRSSGNSESSCRPRRRLCPERGHRSVPSPNSPPRHGNWPRAPSYETIVHVKGEGRQSAEDAHLTRGMLYLRRRVAQDAACRRE